MDTVSHNKCLLPVSRRYSHRFQIIPDAAICLLTRASNYIVYEVHIWPYSRSSRRVRVPSGANSPFLSHVVKTKSYATPRSYHHGQSSFSRHLPLSIHPLPPAGHLDLLVPSHFYYYNLSLVNFGMFLLSFFVFYACFLVIRHWRSVTHALLR